MKSIILKIFIVSIFISSQYINAQNKNFIDFKIRNGLSYINSVRINSKVESNSFILDTGSEYTVLSTSFANTIKDITQTKKINVEDISGKSAIHNSTIIDSLKFGSNVYYNVKTLILELPYGIDGIIGNNILNKNIWEIDYPNGKISRFYDISQLKNIPKYFILFKQKKGIPVVNIKIGKIKIRNVIFDTGNVNKLSLKAKDSVLIGNELLNYFYHEFYGKTFNEKSESLKHIKSGVYKKISFGNYTIDSINTNFMGKRTIGNGLILNSKIILDYISNKIYFNNLKPTSYPYLGCWFEINKNGDILVSSLTKNSPADKSGIKINDILIYANNYRSDKTLKDSILDGSFYQFQTKSVTLKMKTWSIEKKIDME